MLHRPRTAPTDRLRLAKNKRWVGQGDDPRHRGEDRFALSEMYAGNKRHL
jgi:hypothetical protein